MKSLKQIYLAVALLPFFAFADWTQLSHEEFTLSPPPMKGSSAYEKDIRTLLTEQSRRTDAQCDLAASQLHPTFENMFVESEVLSASQGRKYGPLIEKVMKVTEKISGHFKGKYQRVRPYDADKRIQPCIQKPGGQRSYPSSHSSMATAATCVLAIALPNRAEQLEAYGEEISNIRYVVGVHFPSDVAAGKKLGKEICELIAQNEDFQAELEK